MNSIDEIKLLRDRVGELEQRVEHLRVSRRVLMNLLEKVEREKVALVRHLEKENVRLQRDNKRFAKWIFSKNREIVELQDKMESSAQKA
ncbi:MULTISPECIES: translation initiation factor 2 [Desulfosporosinus]|uniref:Translation initiation factor 2 n=1 Tax=Desulfosporosinus nitroreducens TaxID=2018668 RepID=A0ABT8QJT1_9FIRM|nr:MULTISPECIES: translation initiation factor 2 [Desulfosporosinus]MCB8817736.1 translation initiation factor 2 [Desulfosporosinus sp. SRJS8]MCO1600487.1 translation initiation factor 2 [Desulfosporosinus nitroreducens]MDO0821574.1 translation initiation factor 2 [Desulfosporosinus nitroreducens]